MFYYYTLMQLNGSVIKTILSNTQFYISIAIVIAGFILTKKYHKKQQIPTFKKWKIESFMVIIFYLQVLSSFCRFPYTIIAI